MTRYCENAVSSRVVYTYLGDPATNTPTTTGEVISNAPPVVITCNRASVATTDCIRYQFRIVVRTFDLTGPGMQGERYDENTFGGVYVAYGPIGRLRMVTVPSASSRFGIRQSVELECRGPSYFSECQPYGFYGILPYEGGVGSNSLIDGEKMLLDGILPTGVPYLPEMGFSITDDSGLIYYATGKSCPTVSVFCEGYCAPGNDRIGGCCVDCDALTNSLESIRQAVGRI